MYNTGESTCTVQGRRVQYRWVNMYSSGGLISFTTNGVYSEYSLIPPQFVFKKIWWIYEFGGLTGYSLVFVHYIGTGKCGGLKGLADKEVVD